MAFNPTIMQAVEQLGYRVTVGDVATHSGLNVNLAQRDLLALTSDVGGHLQVTETGEIVYLLPKHFRAILRSKFLRSRLEEAGQIIWNIFWYLIRISFGIILIASIALIWITIAIILIASIFKEGGSFDIGGGSSGSSSGGSSGGEIFGFFDSSNSGSSSGSSGEPKKRRRKFAPRKKEKINFLEATFSFIFGDGDPNKGLEKRRFAEIATVITNNKGAIIAEQVIPYLDKIPQESDREDESYMLPVLTRFNGIPEVSPDGELIYYFPDLQTTAQNLKKQPVAPYLYEWCWRFSEASSGNIWLAFWLGVLNCVGAVVLGILLAGEEVMKMGGLVALARSIYWFLLVYGVGFLAIPLVRYVWIQWKNGRIEERNGQRKQRMIELHRAEATLQKKMAYAQQFAATHLIGSEDITYTTETDLLEQNDNFFQD